MMMMMTVMVKKRKQPHKVQTVKLPVLLKRLFTVSKEEMIRQKKPCDDNINKRALCVSI